MEALSIVSECAVSVSCMMVVVSTHMAEFKKLVLLLKVKCPRTIALNEGCLLIRHAL